MSVLLFSGRSDRDRRGRSSVDGGVVAQRQRRRRPLRVAVLVDRAGRGCPRRGRGIAVRRTTSGTPRRRTSSSVSSLAARRTAARVTASAMGERVAIRLAASLAGPASWPAQCGEDVGDGLAGEALVDPMPLCGKGTGGRLRPRGPRVPRRRRRAITAAVNASSASCGTKWSAKPMRDGVGPGERRTGQRGVQAEIARVRGTTGRCRRRRG